MIVKTLQNKIMSSNGVFGKSTITKSYIHELLSTESRKYHDNDITPFYDLTLLQIISYFKTVKKLDEARARFREFTLHFEIVCPTVSHCRHGCPIKNPLWGINPTSWVCLELIDSIRYIYNHISCNSLQDLTDIKNIL